MNQPVRGVSQVISVLLISLSTTALAGNWPHWRGAGFDGIAADATPPLTWSETENVKWKTALPGVGQSTPIIWGDKIFLQTTVAQGVEMAKTKSAFGGLAPESQPITVPHKFFVICLDRETGKILWETEVCETKPHEGHHPSGSLAPYSPVTDGEYVWASFGSRGIYCLDFEGNIEWSAPIIQMNKAGRFGEGSSPALAGDVVVVLADHEGQSKIYGFDKRTGELRWENDRDEDSSWSSPLPVEVDGRIQIVTSANSFIRSYDAETGDLIWQCGGLTNCAAPTPVAANGMVYCTTGFMGSALLAIELGHTGDLTDTDAVVWEVKKAGANVPTPLVYNGNIYVFEGYKGVLSAYNAETGEPAFRRERIKGIKQIYSSPLGVAGRIYAASREGTTVVLEAGNTLNILASNTLDEVLDGSPVAIGNELYLRGRQHLYCIAD